MRMYRSRDSVDFEGPPMDNQLSDPILRSIGDAVAKLE